MAMPTIEDDEGLIYCPEVADRSSDMPSDTAL